MKHLTRKLTSMVLAVIMVLALCPAVFAATVATVEYDKVLFSEDFDGDTELNHELVARAEENVLNNRVENGVMVLSKNATSGGNYFRMRFNNTKYNDVACLDEIYAEHPERLSQVRATMDFYFVDSITPFNIAAYDTITNPEGTNSKTNNELALINTNGEVKVGGKVIAAVVADTWYTVEIILDFNTDKFSLKISDETGEIGASAPRKTGDLDECINSFGISVGNMKDVSYTMYFDNMKFEVPSENVEKYTSKLLNLDFEGENDIIDCSIENGLTVTTINEEGRGMVAQMVPDGVNYGMFSVNAARTQGYYTYDKYGKYPDIIKVEVDLFKTNYAGAYICFDGEYIFFWDNTNEITVYSETEENETEQVKTGKKHAASKGWITITLDMNFKTRKYDIYVNGEKLGDTYNIPSAIVSPEKMGIRVHKGQTALYVDNMSISAAAPYESNEICAYLDENGILGYGYVLNNADAENALSYDIYAAKFDSTGKLVSATKTPDSVAAGTMELKNIEVSYADDGGFYRYFMFENGTLRPLN